MPISCLTQGEKQIISSIIDTEQDWNHGEAFHLGKSLVIIKAPLWGAKAWEIVPRTYHNHLHHNSLGVAVQASAKYLLKYSSKGHSSDIFIALTKLKYKACNIYLVQFINTFFIIPSNWEAWQPVSSIWKRQF